MPESFVFYESYLRGIELQDEQAQNRLFLAVCRYALRGEEPCGLSDSELGIFELMRPTVDANTQRRENSTKGGRHKKTMVSEKVKNEKPMVLQNSEIEKPNENGNGNETENETGDENKTEKASEDNSQVELTDEELSELEQLSDSLSVKAYIKKLSDWQQQNGKRSHKPFAVIKKWIQQDCVQSSKRTYSPSASEKEQSYNIDAVIEMSRNFIKNNADLIDK